MTHYLELRIKISQTDSKKYLYGGFRLVGAGDQTIGHVEIYSKHFSTEKFDQNSILICLFIDVCIFLILTIG